MTKKTIILVFLVFILALFARIYLMSVKQGLHSDETFIIKSINNEQNLQKKFEPNKYYTALDIKKMDYSPNNDTISILKSIKNIRTNNPDKLTPNVYPSLIRLSQINVRAYDIKGILNRALFVNLIIFILSFLAMLKLLNALDIDKNFIPLALLIAFLNTGSLSTFLFVKPYILQELAYIFLTYVFVIEIKRVQNETSVDFSFKNIIMPTLAVCFALLSGYFSLIYIFFLAVTYIIFCIIYKKQKYLFNIAGILALSLLATLIIYPDFFAFFEFKNPTNGKYVLDFFDSAKQYFKILSSYLFYLPICIVLCICLVLKMFKVFKIKSTLIPIIFILSFITGFLSLFFGLFKVLRYTSPTLALMSLIITYLISSFENKALKNILTVIISLIYISGFLFASVIESPDSDISGENPKPFFPNIENTFVSTNCTAIQNSNIPIIIFSKETWPINNIIPYMKDSQKILVSQYDEKEKITPPEHFIALVAYDDVKSPDGYLLMNNFRCQRFEGYELKKEK